MGCDQNVTENTENCLSISTTLTLRCIAVTPIMCVSECSGTGMWHICLQIPHPSFTTSSLHNILIPPLPPHPSSSLIPLLPLSTCATLIRGLVSPRLTALDILLYTTRMLSWPPQRAALGLQLPRCVQHPWDDISLASVQPDEPPEGGRGSRQE